MSRVILTCHPLDGDGQTHEKDAEPHLVVGWDRPLATYFWQIMGTGNDAGTAIMWQGYNPNELPTWDEFMKSLPKEFENKFSERNLRDLLESHQQGRDSANVIVDWSEPNGWIVEVIADNSGIWVANAIVLAKKDEAEAYGQQLASSWMLVRDMRVVPTNEPPNYMFRGGTLMALKVAS
jgi:hypothetical protein